MAEIPTLPGIRKKAYDIVTPLKMLTKPHKLFNRYFSLNTEVFHIRLAHERWVFLAGANAVRFFSQLNMENVDPYQFRSRMYTLQLPNFQPPEEFAAVAQETSKVIKKFFSLNSDAQIKEYLTSEVKKYVDEHLQCGVEIPSFHDFFIKLSTTVFGKLFFGENLFEHLNGKDYAEQYICLDKNLAMLPLILPVFSSFNSSNKKAKVKIEEHLLRIVQKEKAQLNADSKMNIVNGYLGLRDQFKHLTDENVVWLLHAMYWAAVHYTSVHAIWIGVKILSDNEIMSNLLKEQKLYDQITPSSLNEMIYLGGVIKESLRKECVFALPRRVIKEFKYNDFVIPKGDIVAISPYIEHFNPANFEDPNRYDPLRWCTTQVNTQFLIPGGLGHFGCIGMDLSSQLLKITWAYLLQNYNLKLLVKPPKRTYNLILLPPKKSVKIVANRKK